MAVSLVLAVSLVTGSFAHRNVLLIVADDAGRQLGHLGDPLIRTPHLDSLATRSAIFTEAYSSVSSCSPSRSALLTGLPVHQNGMYGLHHSEHHYNSHDNVRSLSRILKQGNITTGIIGKKHVGPEKVYPFDFAETEENNSINSVGRNITHMASLMRKFLKLALSQDQPFFLYMAPHDPHRCGHTEPQFGSFCEKYGNGEPGMGSIPDWSPALYPPELIPVPAWVPDTPASRADLSALYTTLSRLDQGVGLFLRELEAASLIEDTLIIFSSDNGISFPLGRTNLYTGGVQQPLLVSSPAHPVSHGEVFNHQVSLLDLVPTVLDWLAIPYPHYSIFRSAGPVVLTGSSLLSLLNDQKPNLMGGQQSNPVSHDSRRLVYGSHVLHEATMYYPMRSLRSARYTLIHNLNYWAAFPIDQDGYLSPTFQDLLQRSEAGFDLHWNSTLADYYFRPEWELFDRKSDPFELHSVAKKPRYQAVLSSLAPLLSKWQKETADPWLCSPHAVLEKSGAQKGHPQCMQLYN